MSNPTVEDQILQINKKLDTVIANQTAGSTGGSTGATDLTPVLDKLALVDAKVDALAVTADAILAQDQPTAETTETPAQA